GDLLDVQASLEPAPQIGRHALDHCETERPANLRILERRQKFGGRSNPAILVHDPAERLEAQDFSGLDRDFRLIERNDPVALDRAANHAQHAELILGGVQHSWIEDQRAIAADVLGAIEREVGGPENLAPACAMLGEAGYADAAIALDRMAAIFHPLPQSAQHTARDQADPLVVGGVAQQDRELVAAEPCNQVSTACHAFDALGGRAQDQIPGFMAKGIVDELEIVEIEQQERDRLGFRARLRDDRLYNLVQSVPARQARQRIEVGQLPQLVARAPQAKLPPHDHDLEGKHEDAQEGRGAEIDDAVLLGSFQHLPSRQADDDHERVTLDATITGQA